MQPVCETLSFISYPQKQFVCLETHMTVLFIYFADMAHVSPSVENFSWPKHLEDFTTTVPVGTTPQLSITRFMSLLSDCGLGVFRPVEWNSDVDTYVVDTNYDEYALVVMYKQKTGGEKSTSVKLYGKTTLFFLGNISTFFQNFHNFLMSFDLKSSTLKNNMPNMGMHYRLFLGILLLFLFFLSNITHTGW